MTNPPAVGRPRSRRLGLAVFSASLLTIGGSGFLPGGLGAQDANLLAAACTAAGGDAALCGQAAVGADWLGRSLAAFAAHGAVSPDVQRTMGRRVQGGTPRIGISVRPAFGGVRHPGLRGVPSPEVDELYFGAQAALQAGVFEGFQPYPTVGGVLALDAMAGVGWMWLPASDGYDGAVRTTSVGARIGLLRESFSAPGVALTYARVWSEEAVFGSSREVRADPATHALRLGLGKDLGGIGVHLAVGRDWIDNDVAIGVAGAALTDTFDDTVDSVVAGVSLNYLVVRFEGEFGWAFGRGDASPTVPGFDPGEGTPLGALSVRLVF